MTTGATTPDVRRNGPQFDVYDERTAEKMLRWEVPGIASYLGIRITDVAPGRVTAGLELRPELMTNRGSVHGGVLATLTDHVIACVLYPVIPKRAWAATTEFKLNFVAPVREGRLEARAEIVALTRSTAVVQATATNAGRTVGLGLGTVTIRLPKEELG